MRHFRTRQVTSVETPGRLCWFLLQPWFSLFKTWRRSIQPTKVSFLLKIYFSEQFFILNYELEVSMFPVISRGRNVSCNFPEFFLGKERAHFNFWSLKTVNSFSKLVAWSFLMLWTMRLVNKFDGVGEKRSEHNNNFVILTLFGEMTFIPWLHKLCNQIIPITLQPQLQLCCWVNPGFCNWTQLNNGLAYLPVCNGLI